MSSKTFKLELKEGLLIIPPEVTEYLRQCPDEAEIALMIQSQLNTSFNRSSTAQTSQQYFQTKWNSWLEEVDRLEISPSNSNPDDYGTALLEKYRHQGLDV
jgi:hypothetical protein